MTAPTQIQTTAFLTACRFIGMKEVAGQANNDAILAMLRLDTSWPQGDEVAWCFAGDVEILTDSGFCRFDVLQDDAVVAQVDPFLLVTLTKPVSVIRKRHNGGLFRLSGRDFSLTCDREHRFLGVWNRANSTAGPVELRPLSDLTSSLFIPRVRTARAIDDQTWSDRDIRLLAAFLSDGFLHRGKVSIQVSKPRKLEALRALEPSNIYEAKIAYGQSTVPLTTFDYESPAVFGGVFDNYKAPKWSLLWGWSQRQVIEFLNCYVKFDGHENGGSWHLYTSVPMLRDWLQTAVTLAGFHSSHRVSSISPYSGKPCHAVVFAPEKRTRTIRPDQVIAEEGECDLFCVQVPSGVIVIRDPNGAVIPVGNCSAFTNYVAWMLGLPRSRSLAARSWLHIGEPVALDEAIAGNDIVVLMRGGSVDVAGNTEPGSETIAAPGHVGFFAGRQDGDVLVLGGNQDNSVSIKRYPEWRVLGVRRLV
jgi:hypothetical protein